MLSLDKLIISDNDLKEELALTVQCRLNDIEAKNITERF